MSEQETLNCINVQRALQCDPRHIDPPIQQHLQNCHRCAQFAHEISSFDAHIHAGLNINVPEQLAEKILLAKGVQENRQQKKFSHWLKGAAAGVTLLAGSIGSYLYLSTPLLIEEIALTHVRDELHHLGDRKNIQLAQLNNMLKPLQMKMAQSSYTINYAGSCKIRNSQGIHIVLQGERSPVTLLIMPDEHIHTRKTVEDKTFKGIVVPLKKGSVAIITDKQEALDAYEKQLVEQLKFI
jgi:hypothetical protein